MRLVRLTGEVGVSLRRSREGKRTLRVNQRIQSELRNGTGSWRTLAKSMEQGRPAPDRAVKSVRYNPRIAMSSRSRVRYLAHACPPVGE